MVFSVGVYYFLWFFSPSAISLSAISGKNRAEQMQAPRREMSVFYGKISFVITI